MPSPFIGMDTRKGVPTNKDGDDDQCPPKRSKSNTTYNDAAVNTRQPPFLSSTNSYPLGDREDRGARKNAAKGMDKLLNDVIMLLDEIENIIQP